METAQNPTNTINAVGSVVPDNTTTQKTSVSKTFILLLIICLIALIVSGLISYSSTSKVSILNKKVDKLSKENSDLVFKVKDLENTVADQKDELQKYNKGGSEGLKAIIKTIPMTEKFKIVSTKTEYEIKNAYLTPIIIDLPSDSKIDLTGKYFLMFEVNVKDTRTTGKRVLTPVKPYIRLQKDKTILTSFIDDYLWLSPGESKTYYTGIAVEITDKVFTLLVGEGKKPKTIKLDFSSSTIDAREGVFLLKEGYKEEYIN